jgi:hypothetical protein
LKIVIRKGKEPWKVVESSGYNNESHLQALMAEDPTLVPVADLGSSISPFVIAVREVTLHGSGSLDILAFNETGDMAVMECKLADNPEIRRKVIGQIVEYAAFLNKLDYEQLDEVVLRRSGQHLHKLMEAKVADPEWDVTDFQAAVERNLSEGRFSLIIVVDRMDDTLAVTLEYLNTCGFRNVSLHALEMSHLSDDEMEILIPQVHGGGSPPPPPSGSRPTWTEDDFLRQVAEKAAPAIQDSVRQLLAFSKEHADRISWGKGKTGSVTFQLQIQSKPTSIFSLFSDGYLFISYPRIVQTVADPRVAETFRDALMKVPKFRNASFKENKFPGCRLADMQNDLGALQEAVLVLKRSVGGQ